MSSSTPRNLKLYWKSYNSKYQYFKRPEFEKKNTAWTFKKNQPGSIPPNVLDSKGILNKKPGILLPIPP